MALDQTELAQIVSAVISALRADGAASPKASSRFLPKGSHAAPTDLASKDAALINAFHRKGFRDVVLMDRSNPKAAYNVRPFKAWLAEGRIVRRGQRGVRGLFHITQTDALPGKAAPKPAISAETKTLFETAKKALKAKKAQSTLPLA